MHVQAAMGLASVFLTANGIPTGRMQQSLLLTCMLSRRIAPRSRRDSTARARNMLGFCQGSAEKKVVLPHASLQLPARTVAP